MTAQRLIEDIRKQAEENNVRMILRDSETIAYPTGGFEVSGYFVAYERPTLAVAVGKPIEDWILILAHEGSHMEQWIEKSPYWTGSFIEGKEAVDRLDEWCSGKEMTKEELDDICRRSRDVEWDCERRTIEKIEKYDLPVNMREEIQKANSYIFLYTLMKEFRKWPERRPYQVKEVWSQMPDNFDVNYEQIPENIKELYGKFCY